MPALPTAQPLSASVNHTALRLKSVLLAGRVQVTPASAVARISPPLPTTQPWRPSVWKNTSLRTPVELLTCGDQPVVPGSTSTSTVSATPPISTMSSASPSPKPSTRPVLVARSTPASVVRHASGSPATGLPLWSNGVAEYCWVMPTPSVSAATVVSAPNAITTRESGGMTIGVVGLLLQPVTASIAASAAAAMRAAPVRCTGNWIGSEARLMGFRRLPFVGTPLVGGLGRSGVEYCNYKAIH